jgi:hypothetical protein
VTDGKPISDVIKEKQTSANFYDNVDLRSSISQISLIQSLVQTTLLLLFLFLAARRNLRLVAF